MYNTPYFIPNFYSNIAPSMMRGAIGNTALRGIGASRGLGLFARLGQSINAIKAINWGGLINNTSKTLGIINQTIPLVRQVGPMMNNMRSMLKVASIFKDETDNIPKRNNTPNNNYNNTTKSQNNYTPQTIQAKHNIKENMQPTNHISQTYQQQDYSPTFFIAS